MPRMTRAKAHEVAEQLHLDEDAVLELSGKGQGGVDIMAGRTTPDPADRNPLTELAPNSGGNSAEEEMLGLRKSKRGKRAGKKDKEGYSEVDMHEFAQKHSDAGKSAWDELSELAGTVVDSPESLARSKMSEAHSTRDYEIVDSMTETSQSRDVEEPKVLRDETVESVSPKVRLSETVEQREESSTHLSDDRPASPLLSAVPKVIAQLRRETPTKRSTSNKENVEPTIPMLSTPTQSQEPDTTPGNAATYDTLEDAVVQGSTPPTTTAPRQLAALNDTEIPPKEVISPSRSHDSIAALDALDEAVEAVSAQVPDVQASPAKPRPRPDSLAERKPLVRNLSKKAAPVVRTTKASQARISLAHPTSTTVEKRNPKTSALARPRPSSVYGRSSVFTTTNDDQPRQKTSTVIPHSKPRPVSLSFPTPPPPPKSRKAPTKSTFQLPGEAVAAKLKAAREERLKVEAEGAEALKNGTAVSKAVTRPHHGPLSFPTPPPPPKSRKPPTRSTFQLPGEAVAAKLKAAREERLKSEEMDKVSTAGVDNNKSDTSGNRVPFKARPVPASMSKAALTVRQTSASRARQSLMAGESKEVASSGSRRASNSTSQNTSLTAGAPNRSTTKSAPTPAAPNIAASDPSELKVSKRSSTITPSASTATPAQQHPGPKANSSAPRSSLVGSTRLKPGITSTTTKKGREVFSRAALAQDAAEKEKKAKEDAAKKARAVAAERGRVASREWAEKKRQREAGAGGKKTVVAVAVAVVTSEAGKEGVMIDGHTSGEVENDAGDGTTTAGEESRDGGDVAAVAA